MNPECHIDVIHDIINSAQMNDCLLRIEIDDIDFMEHVRAVFDHSGS